LLSRTANFALGGDGNPGVPIKAVGVALVIPRLGYLCAAGPEHHVSGYALANAIQVRKHRTAVARTAREVRTK
jgi:hypothetical protein